MTKANDITLSVWDGPCQLTGKFHFINTQTKDDYLRPVFQIRFPTKSEPIFTGQPLKSYLVPIAWIESPLFMRRWYSELPLGGELTHEKSTSGSSIMMHHHLNGNAELESVVYKNYK